MSENVLPEQLRQFRFLQEIDEKFLNRLAAMARVVEFPAGKVLYREGQPLSNIYLILSGSVSIEICAAGIGCRRIMTVSAGDLLGISPAVGQTRFDGHDQDARADEGHRAERQPSADVVRAQSPLRIRVHASGGGGDLAAAERHASAAAGCLRRASRDTGSEAENKSRGTA